MWRSLLFVPVLEDRFVAKAAHRGADAVVLDLEASIPAARKSEARAALPAAVAKLSPETDVTVRINPLWMGAVRDLEASVIDGVKALHITRCNSPQEVEAIDGLISELEAERGLPHGGISLIALLETPSAVLNAEKIAKASSRLIALTLGVEDYAMEMGGEPASPLLEPACHLVIQAARSAGIEPILVPASIADFRDTAGLEVAAQRAKSMGSTGGYAVHPAQVAVLNRVFSPTGTELAWAERVLTAADEAEIHGQAVFQLDGKMIDLPIIKRARRIADVARIAASRELPAYT